MKNRWQMNRMGLVNFWYFDDQEFNFANGKLLIRGQNGSGKSITTQSFIPFILDGNRAPHRLDPFGSRDRKMEYYFLLDGVKDDSTGYIWLEFKKQDSSQYLTIAIGQRARKNKGIDFWGMIIADNRRVGIDFNFKRKNGAQYQILDKKEIRDLLGSENFFTESSNDYKHEVNKRLFGFKKIEQYEQFVNLLIKIRAPKLSKEFKPTKIYEIYNETLQVLLDEDILPMVESMERIEDMQTKLEGLKETKRALDNIARVYSNYNRYFIAKKAGNFLKYQGEYQVLENKITSLESGLKTKVTTKTALETDIEGYEKENELLKIERENLPIEDIERYLENYQSAKVRLEQRETYRQEQLDDYQRTVERRDRKYLEKKQVRDESDQIDYQISKIVRDLKDSNRIIQFEDHLEIENLSDYANFIACQERIEANLKLLSEQVFQARKALVEARELETEISQLQEELAKLNYQLEELTIKLDDQATTLEDEKDRIVTQYYLARDNYQVFRIDKAIKELEQIVRNYQGFDHFKKIDARLSELKRDQERGIDLKINRITHEKAVSAKDKDELNQQLVDLINREEISYPHSELIEKSRQLLTKAKIAYLPLYQALEFQDDLSERQKSVLESQLIATNLIDALVVARHDYDRAKQLLKNNEGALVDISTPPAQGAYFKCDDNHDFQDEITSFIASINNATNPIRFDLDGYYRYGLVEGYVSDTQESIYVGLNQRKRNRENQIAKLQEQLRELDRIMAGYDQKLSECANEQIVLDREYQGLLDFDRLDQITQEIRELEGAYQATAASQNKTQLQLNEKFDFQVALKNRIMTLTRGLPYNHRVDIFEEVCDHLEFYGGYLREMNMKVNNLITAKNNLQALEDIIVVFNNQADNYQVALDKIEEEIAQLKTQIKTIDAYLNQPDFKNAALRATKIDQIVADNTIKIKAAQTKINGLDLEMAVIKNDLERDQAEINEKKRLYNEAKRIYELEEQLELVNLKGSNQKSRIKEASDLINDSEKAKSAADMLQDLHNSCNSNSSPLTSYGINIVDVFKENSDSLLEKRRRITLMYSTQRMYFYDFRDQIKHNINETQYLIEEKDKELFEKFFSDTLARKLIEKINDSKQWVNDMSKLMANLKTTSAISFSLDWKPKPALGDDDLGTGEVVKLLEVDQSIISYERQQQLSRYFRNRINLAKQEYLDNEDYDYSYADLVKRALDYREWYEFRLYSYRKNENKRELTNSRFNVLSGGEKAMAMYVPLFTAVNAQYLKAAKKTHPRIIAMDEAFAGVDSENIGSMFELVETLDLDCIMNSQNLWGTHGSVKALAITELYRPLDSDIVSILNYRWDGKEKVFVGS